MRHEQEIHEWHLSLIPLILKLVMSTTLSVGAEPRGKRENSLIVPLCGCKANNIGSSGYWLLLRSRPTHASQASALLPLPSRLDPLNHQKKNKKEEEEVGEVFITIESSKQTPTPLLREQRKPPKRSRKRKLQIPELSINSTPFTR